MNIRTNKKGASRVTSDMLMNVGQYLLPILAFLVVLYIVVSVGSARTSQTYYQTVEFTNIISALATFNGQAFIRYVPIMDDFTFEIKDSVIYVNTKDNDAPNQRILRVPAKLPFTFLATSPGANERLGQVRFVRTYDGLRVDKFNSPNIDIYLETKYKPEMYVCGDKLQLVKQPIFVSIDKTLVEQDILKGSTVTDLKNRIQNEKIVLTYDTKESGLLINFTARKSTFNSVVIFSDGSPKATAFVCAFANFLTSLDSAQLKTNTDTQRIESIVVVPQDYVPLGADDWGESQDLSKLFIEYSYDARATVQSPDAQFNIALAKAIAAGYGQVYS